MKPRSLLIVLSVVLLLAACAPMAKALPTPTAAATLAPPATGSPTATPRPTQTPTPTPEPYVIDMEKFHNFPASYEYLLAHPDEFVQAPDPLSDRAAFDKWFAEKLVPALGPLSERPINVLAKGGGGGHDVWVEFIDPGTKTASLPPFFWFKSKNVLYGVPCVTTAIAEHEDITRITVCPALFESSALIYGTRALNALTSGQGIMYLMIYYDPRSYRPDLDWGDASALVKSIGDYPIDENRVKFGFGCIEFYN